MPYCYHCGENNARYSRHVETGQSTGRSNGNTYNNTYTGNRFLCEECAYKIDLEKISWSVTKRMIIVIFLVWFLISRIF
jgi:hypothetical protein